MRMTRHVAGAIAALGLAAPGLALTGTAPADASAGVEAGILTCHSIPGQSLSYIIQSRVNMDCTFNRADGTVQHYTGRAGIGLGIDLHLARQEEVSYTVVGAATDVDPGSGSLTGTYVGGKAEVTPGMGLGAQALIGGSGDNVALEPIALETTRGFGLSAGVAYLTLEPAQKSAGEPGGKSAR